MSNLDCNQQENSYNEHAISAGIEDEDIDQKWLHILHIMLQVSFSDVQ